MSIKETNKIKYIHFILSILVIKFSKLALDGQALRAFFDMSDNLCIDIERLADGYHLLGYFRTHVDLHAVTHVEHLIHLLPVGA